jgi:mono/diheme cytochrome c family protein
MHPDRHRRRGEVTSRSLALIMVLALVAACSREHATTSFITQPPKVADPEAGAAPLYIVQLEPRPAALQGLATHRVDVDDPVYRRLKRYEGFRLDEIVDRLTPARRRLGDDAHLVLVCLDGYRAQLRLGLARNGGAILAMRDRDAAETWEKLPPGTAVGTPAPFYLVWGESSGSSRAKLPWPYGVVAVEVWLADPADRAKPSRTTDGIGTGYAVFREKCISCHRVNGAGGTLGAELNTPANVTEYWKPVALRQFILNPASIRAASRMPKLTSLTEEEVDAVLAYLASMKYQKLVVK